MSLAIHAIEELEKQNENDEAHVKFYVIWDVFYGTRFWKETDQADTTLNFVCGQEKLSAHDEQNELLVRSKQEAVVSNGYGSWLVPI